MSRQFDEHRQYLEDTARLSAFDRAIRATVRPGDVVVDLGCGSGILGLMAVRAGASRVYAIDDSGMVAVARRIAVANGVADRVVHIAGLSTRVALPEPVDVVLADQMGKWLLAIPHYVVLFFLVIAAFFVVIVAWFAILFTGRYPKGMFEFVVGVMRWAVRVSAYAALLTTDEYPPFTLREQVR